MTNTQDTLGDLVTAIPIAAKVFHKHGLDFCCGGTQTLQQACEADGLDPQAVIAEIDGLMDDGCHDIPWDRQPIEDLIAHILSTYHEPLKTELPRLVMLAAKVESVHEERPDCPAGLSTLLRDILTAVESHLAKEEQILFPLILSGRGRNAHMPIQQMLQEHDDHGRNLQHIRSLTDNLILPEGACASWRELYRSLAALEVDLMAHIHLENSVLFRRALTE